MGMESASLKCSGRRQVAPGADPEGKLRIALITCSAEKEKGGREGFVGSCGLGEEDKGGRGGPVGCFERSSSRTCGVSGCIPSEVSLLTALEYCPSSMRESTLFLPRSLFGEVVPLGLWCAFASANSASHWFCFAKTKRWEMWVTEEKEWALLRPDLGGRWRTSLGRAKRRSQCWSEVGLSQTELRQEARTSPHGRRAALGIRLMQ